MNDEFNKQFGEWMSDFPAWEVARVKSHETRKQIETMCEYLMKQEDEPAKVKDIVLWSQLVDQ